MQKDEIEITFQPYGRRRKFLSGITIMEAAKTLGIDISSLCSGKGTCGKCKVKVQRGTEGLNPLTKSELNHLSDEEVKTSIRLACQTRLASPSVILVLERSRVGKQRLQTEGLNVPVKPDALLRKYPLNLPKPTLNDCRSDEDRLLDALREKYDLVNLLIDYDTARTLPITLRKANWRHS